MIKEYVELTNLEMTKEDWFIGYFTQKLNNPITRFVEDVYNTELDGWFHSDKMNDPRWNECLIWTPNKSLLWNRTEGTTFRNHQKNSKLLKSVMNDFKTIKELKEDGRGYLWFDLDDDAIILSLNDNHINNRLINGRGLPTVPYWLIDFDSDRGMNVLIPKFSWFV